MVVKPNALRICGLINELHSDPATAQLSSTVSSRRLSRFEVLGPDPRLCRKEGTCGITHALRVRKVLSAYVVLLIHGFSDSFAFTSLWVISTVENSQS